MIRTSIVIGTYGRDRVLVETIRALLALRQPAGEILMVDQTARHEDDTEADLRKWSEQGSIRWLRQDAPSTVLALNRGLREARGDLVLILDDDIVPSDALVEMHEEAHERHPEAWAVVGQILQPGESPQEVVFRGATSGLRAFETFPFNSCQGLWIGNVMAGNLSVKRSRAFQVGGFDENFTPPVAYRFETEFARRLLAAGGRIRFEPRASVRHLRAASGGTRSRGSHLASASPVHGVGDYYYALRCGTGVARWAYMLRRPFREVRTRFHARHPWYIPVKFVGEWRAFALALRLYRRGPRLLGRAWDQHA